VSPRPRVAGRWWAGPAGWSYGDQRRRSTADRRRPSHEEDEAYEGSHSRVTISPSCVVGVERLHGEHCDSVRDIMGTQGDAGELAVGMVTIRASLVQGNISDTHVTLLHMVYILNLIHQS
jgi:hypothetical protein